VAELVNLLKIKIMHKELTNKLRWVNKNGTMVLQQAWYWEWTNDYTWEDVPTIEESESE
jgi:hypothetical protein